VPPSKRLLADRVSHLRSPESGSVGQGLRYAVAGSVVAVWYLATTTVLAELFGMAFQLALAIGFATAVLVHFTLQRFFVWVHPSEFALGIGAQVGRYLAVAAVQYVITAAATSALPSALGLPVTPVYLATALLLAAVNFLIFRGGVFHHGAEDAPNARGEEGSQATTRQPRPPTVG
jgi:putative flippase GtrA